MREILRAIALKYDPVSGGAPRVSASGRDEVAARILELAEEFGVPVREEPDLVEMLSCLELGEEIPQECYEVVAEILSMIILMRREAGIGR